MAAYWPASSLLNGNRNWWHEQKRTKKKNGKLKREGRSANQTEDIFKITQKFIVVFALLLIYVNTTVN